MRSVTLYVPPSRGAVACYTDTKQTSRREEVYQARDWIDRKSPSPLVRGQERWWTETRVRQHGSSLSEFFPYCWNQRSYWISYTPLPWSSAPDSDANASVRPLWRLILNYLMGSEADDIRLDVLAIRETWKISQKVGSHRLSVWRTWHLLQQRITHCLAVHNIHYE